MDQLKEYQKWLGSEILTEAEKDELRQLGDEDIKSRFVSLLQFGTAGLRGLLGTGLYRMNIYTVRHATKALSEVIKKEFPESVLTVAVAYDSRNMSKEFAFEACRVLASEGIKSYLFDELRPTPELSYAVRELKCSAGINITASHNAKEYNGYKVYWNDGAQIAPAIADEIFRRMQNIEIFDGVCVFSEEEASKYITVLGYDFDEKYMNVVLSQLINKDVIKKHENLKIVYTPFHGSGYRLVPEVLRRAGFMNIYTVEKQMETDGNFPTVASPNPENKEGFALAIKKATEVGSDLIIGTDPDADRVGVLVRKNDGDYVVMTGNQTGAVLLDYLITAKKNNGTLLQNACVVKSIVTSELGTEICRRNGISIMNVLTGFKFIGEKMEEFKEKKNYTYLFGYEESYGCLVGDYARDKDAVSASMMIAEAAAYYADQGKTLKDALDGLFEKYGFFKEKVLNIIMDGTDAQKKMSDITGELRKNGIGEIGGFSVTSVLDYIKGIDGLPSADVLYYKLSDGTVVIVRPSGTEPKMKIYIMTSAKDENSADKKISAVENGFYNRIKAFTK